MNSRADLDRAAARRPPDQLLKPPLSPAHGTSLGTTAGITAVITLVAAFSLLGQRTGASDIAALLTACAEIALLLGAGALYAARNEIGRALDLAAGDARASGLSAARGLMLYHLGMVGVFAGTAFAAAVRLGLVLGRATWLIAAVAVVATAVAVAQARGWVTETRRRGRE